jgi:hypothetical protein
MSRRDLAAVIGWAATAALIVTFYWTSVARAALPTDYYGRAYITAPTITGSHTDVPVVFSAQKGELWNMAPDASDVRIYTDSGTMVPHEIAFITADSVGFWFEAPALETGSGFYVYFGSDDPPTALATTEVWGSAAVAYHYGTNPAAGTLDDAAGTTDGATAGDWLSSYRGDGQIGTGWFNDSYRGVSVPDLNVTGDWTISAWLKPIGSSTDVIAMGNPWWWFVAAQASNANPQPSFVARYGDWNVSYAFTGCANDGTWAKYDVVFTTSPDTALTIYRNGEVCTVSGIFEIGGTNFGGADISGWYELGYDIDLLGRNFNGGSAPFGVASQSYATGGNQQDQYNGWVDEYVIYESALAAGQIAAQYSNQADPAGWWNVNWEFNLTAEAENQTEPPVITAASAPINTNGDEITIRGFNFGSNPLILAPDAVGPSGFIETFPVDTDVTDMGSPIVGTDSNHLGSVGVTGFTDGEAAQSPAVTSVANGGVVKTGSKSLSASFYSVASLAGTARADATLNSGKSRIINFTYAPRFTSFYASWWDWCEPVVHSTDGQRKWWYVGDGPHHARSGAMSFIQRRWFDFQDGGTPDNEVLEIYQPYGRNSGGYWSSSTGLRPEDNRPYSAPIDYCCYNADQQGPFRFVFRPDFNGGVYPAPDGAEKPQGGSKVWQRIEVRGVHNTGAGVDDGELEIWVTTPTEGRRPYAKVLDITHDNADAGGDRLLDGAENDNYSWNTFGVHNFMEYNTGTDDSTSVNMYIDDLYISIGTQARVELGNARTYDACTELHVQYPVRWESDGTSITFRCNNGTFDTDDTTYLYVVNESGQVNAAGFPMVPTPVKPTRDRTIGGE